MAKNMTVKDVAAKAGVSVSTAAAALRGDPCVKPTTAENIMRAAEELGYRRNSAAAAMASLNVRSRQKQAKIAILTGFAPDLPTRPDTAYVLAPQHAKAEAERLGIQCEHINLERPDDLRRTLQSIEKRGCDGIILDSRTSPLETVPEWQRFSIISTDYMKTLDHVDIVRVSQFRTTLKLLRRLQETGFRRIGFLHRKHSHLNSDDEERFGAFAVFDRYDVRPENRIPVLEVSFGDRNYESGVVDWFKTHRPEVIVGFSMTDSIILTKAGIAIPKTVSWVCLHVEEFNRGKMAGLQLNREIAPEYAVRLLMEKIRHGIRGFSIHPSETDVRQPLLAGASCPRLQEDDDF